MKKHHSYLIIASILLLIVVGVVVFVILNNNKDDSKKDIVNIEIIAGYNYALEDRDSKLFKDNFKLLRDELKNESVDFENYAKLLSKLYIIDLYTISNKVNQYDVGGSEFVYASAKDNYELKVRDTIYKYLEDNSYGDRKQKLPTVNSVEIIEVKEKEFKVLDNKMNGYSVSLSWTYEEDMGYDTSATVNLVTEDNKLYVISQSVSSK